MMGDPLDNMPDKVRNLSTGSGPIHDYGGVQGGVHFHEAPAILPAAVQHNPPAIAGVVGREHELGELADRFGHGNAAAIVSESRASLLGVPGIGKSTLAALYCDQYRGKYTAICWRDLRRDGSVTGLVQAFAALDNKEFDPSTMPNESNQADLLAGWLQALPAAYLLVLDNCETILEDNGTAKGGWATLFAQANLGRSRLLVTSRQQLSADRHWAKSLKLEGLTEDEGVALLRQERLHDSDEATLKKAVEKAGGHPLALILLAQLVTESGQVLTDVLDDASPLWHGDRGDIAISLLNEVYNRLIPEQQLLLQYVSIYDRPGFFRHLVSPADIAGMIANLDPDLLPSGRWHEESIAIGTLALTRRSLLNVEEAHYTTHTIVRNYAYKKLIPPAAYHRAAAAHFRSLYTRDGRTNPPQHIADVQPLLDAFDQLCLASEWMSANELMLSNCFAYEGSRGKNLHELLDIWGEYSRIVRLLGRLAVPFAACQLSPEYLAVVLGNLGLAYADLGDPRAAIGYYEISLRISEQIGDLRGQANRLGNLGNSYKNLGDARAAIVYLERALKIDEQIGTLRGQGNHLGNLGSAHAALGETRAAIGFHERALNIGEQIGDLRGQGTHLGNLGNRYAELGDARTAIGYYERALKMAEQIGDRSRQGNHLGNLANAYFMLGETDKAMELYARAIPIQQQLGDVRGEATDWNNLGVLHKNVGRYLEALTCYLRALPIRRRIEDPSAAETERNIRNMRRLVGESDWPTPVQQAAATLAAEGVALDATLLAEVRNIAPAEDELPPNQAE